MIGKKTWSRVVVVALVAVVALMSNVAVVASNAAANGTYESLQKSAQPVQNLELSLKPFVATCDHEKDHFKRLFCSALNERLKAQHQQKLYLYTEPVRENGTLIATFVAGKPAPTMELKLQGCLTCSKPLVGHEGAKISDGRFFVFKTPSDIAPVRTAVAKDARFSLKEIELGSWKVPLPKEATEQQFKTEIAQQLRVDVIYRPIAGVTKLGAKGQFGVINFELAGYRVYNRCDGQVYASMPKATTPYPVDKTDMSCPQNRPKPKVKLVKLPGQLTLAQVKPQMEEISADLPACYNQFGQTGQADTEVVIGINGAVKSVKISGALAKSPTADCIERLVRNAKFPAFSGQDLRIQWPFAVRE